MSATISIFNFQKRWDAVVLLHGLFASNRSMQAARDRFERDGYLVVNFGYKTLFQTIDDYLDGLVPMLGRLNDDRAVQSINFVTHSFGGILVRYALEHISHAKLHRAVMMAPPNNGIRLARYSLGVFDRLFPIVKQISDAPHSLPNSVPEPSGMDVGVIAADRDVIVNRESTKLKNQSDHRTIATTHFRLPYCSEALECASRFLRHGSFDQAVETRSQTGVGGHVVAAPSVAMSTESFSAEPIFYADRNARRAS
ncbi:MAG: esterase/lipase family protein [Aureliella sp.]